MLSGGLREELGKVDAGTWVDPSAGSVTFEQFFAGWAARQVWTSNTQAAMALAVRGTSFRSMELRKIRTTHIETWVKSMATPTESRAALAPGTIKTRFVNVRSVFRAAVRDRLLGVDPTDNVKLPRQRRRAEALTIPSPGEVARCLDVAGERFRPFVAVCALAGLRLGRRPRCSSATSTTHAASCTCGARCSGPASRTWRSGCRSTGPSDRCRCPTSWPASCATTSSSGTSRTGCSRAPRTTRPSGEDRTRQAASSLARQVLPDFAGTVRAEGVLEEPKWPLTCDDA